MDFVLIAIVLIVAVLIIISLALMVFGWLAKTFFGKSDTWLDYGIDDFDL